MSIFSKVKKIQQRNMLRLKNKSWIRRIAIGTNLLPILILLSGLAGLACSSSGTKAPSELRIGLIAPFADEVGEASINAARLIVKEYNDEGGLEVSNKWFNINLIERDNANTPEGSSDQVISLVNQETVIAIIGPQRSSNAIPAAEVAEDSRVPLISPWSTNPETTLNKEWVFRAAFLDPFQGRVLAKFAREELNAERVAVLYDITEKYNKGLAEIFKDSFEKLPNGKVVSFEHYTSDAKEYANQLTKIKESGAEVLFLPNYAVDVLDQVRAAKELGMDIQIIGSDTWGTIDEDQRNELDGAFFTTHYAVDIADEKAQKFVSDYHQEYGNNPNDVAALTYDSFDLLFTALKEQGEVSAEAIKNGLSGITTYDGITGSFKYEPGSGDPVKSAVLLKVEDGAFVFHSLREP